MPGIEIKGRSKIANYRHGGRTKKFGGGRTNLLEQLGRVEAERSNPNRRAEISRVHGELNRGYAAGGAVKIGKRFLDFIKTGKHVDKHGVKVNVPKAAERLTGKPHVDRVKKAVGGRIGFRTGSRGPSAGERIKARKSREREWWTTRGGPEGSKGDTRGQKFFGPYDKELREKRPHSSPEGRAIDVRKRAENYRKNKNLDQVRKNAYSMGRTPFKKGGSDKKWMQKVSASIKKRGTKGKCTPITKPGCTGRAKALAKTFKKMAAKRKA